MDLIQSKQWRALLSLAFSMLLTSIAVSIPNVALPTIAREFGASIEETQRVVVAYLLAVTSTIVFAGRFGDRMGRRKVLLIGLFLYIISTLLCVFAPTLWYLIGARTLQGVSAAIIMPLTMAFAVEVSSVQKAGSSIGLLATISAVGTAAGPSVGGIIVATSSWRCTFMLMALLGVLSFFLVCRYLPESHSKKKRLALQLSILSHGGLGLHLVMNAIVSTVMMSTLIVGPFYLSNTLGLKSMTVGLAMSVGPIMSILSGTPAGRAVDRFGEVRMTQLGLSVMGLGAFAFVVLPPLFGMIGYMISSAILSPGYQLFQAANSTASLRSADVDQRGLISGLLNFSRNLGLMAGASLMGSLYAHSSMKSTFLVAAVLTIIAIVIAQKGKYETELT